MGIEERFDLSGPDLEARGIDHAFEPIDHEEITIFIDATEIACSQESLAVDRDERFLVGFGLIPVTLHDGGAMNDDFAGFALWAFGKRGRVNDA